MFIDFLFNRKKAKSDLDATKRDAISTLKEISNQAKITASSVASVVSNSNSAKTVKATIRNVMSRANSVKTGAKNTATTVINKVKDATKNTTETVKEFIRGKSTTDSGQKNRSSGPVKSVVEGMAGQRKFVNDLKGDSLTKFLASRDSNARKLLLDALKSGFTKRSELRDPASRRSILKDLDSGTFKNELNAFKAASASAKAASQATKAATAETQNYNGVVNKKLGLINRLTQAYEMLNNVSGGGSKRGKKGNQDILKENHRLLNIENSLNWRNVRNILYRYASLYAIERMGKQFFDAAVNREKTMFANSVMFGNKMNASRALDFASAKIKGGAAFQRDDLMSGFKQMMEAGLDPTKNKNFKAIANIAGTTGQKFNEVSSDLVSAFYGNSDALRKYGFTNKQVFSLDRMVNQRPDNRRDVIMSILSNDKRYKNGMRDFAGSWQGMTNTMSEYWLEFKESVMGRAEDKDSLFSKIKGGFQQVINWVAKNQQRIMRIGQAVSTVFKWVGRQVLEFGRYIAHKIEGVLKLTDGTNQSFQQKMMKLTLWLELQKQKVIHFYEKWGWAIRMIAKIWVASKLIGMVNGLVRPFTEMYKTIRSIVGIMPQLINLLTKKAAVEAASSSGTVVSGFAGSGGAIASGAAKTGMFGTVAGAMGMTSAGLLALLGGVTVVAGAIYMISEAMKNVVPIENQNKADKANTKSLDGNNTTRGISQRIEYGEKFKQKTEAQKAADAATRLDYNNTFNRIKKLFPGELNTKINERISSGDTIPKMQPVVINIQNLHTKATNGKELIDTLRKQDYFDKTNN